MSNLGITTLTGCNSIPNFIGTGFLMLFQQSTAPVNWTKQTIHNDKILRVVTGNAVPGGLYSFSSMFDERLVSSSVGDTILDINQIPSHNHTISPNNVCGRFQNAFSATAGPQPLGTTPRFTIGPTGKDESHTHPFSANFINFSVKYVDLIICSKD